MTLHAPIEAVEAFLSRIPRGGQVLCRDSQISAWLTQRGIEVQALDPAKDLRLLSLKRESFDGIWAGTAFGTFPIEDAQRIIASFFQALRPRTGVLFAAHQFPETAFASMIRQNGFQPLLQGQWESWFALVAHRI